MYEHPNLKKYTVKELCLLEQSITEHVPGAEYEHADLLLEIGELIITAVSRGEYLAICDSEAEAQHHYNWRAA